MISKSHHQNPRNNKRVITTTAKKLKIKDTYLGVKDKFTLLNKIAREENLQLSNFAYIGDDVNDLANICSVGWSFAPNNATAIVKLNADVVLSKDSANGAIREACEFISTYNKRF